MTGTEKEDMCFHLWHPVMVWRLPMEETRGLYIDIAIGEECERCGKRRVRKKYLWWQAKFLGFVYYSWAGPKGHMDVINNMGEQMKDYLRKKKFKV